MEDDVGKMSWGVLQRLFDDEPPLRVWREERGLQLAQLAEASGLTMDRLAVLDEELETITDAEVDRLSVALRVPMEYLFVPERASHAA